MGRARQKISGNAANKCSEYQGMPPKSLEIDFWTVHTKANKLEWLVFVMLLLGQRAVTLKNQNKRHHLS